ncbi:hypothetical protein AM571_PA00060 (plasmid) [Rhizobium etli 8C-3]|uniref:Uncharacterized protein n=1 Tax=Rhizobium etli 8C-3 TaxID=538025 RepID=A0A1L5P9U9_RHIET|nr:hypothetical protein AM571_PA00060 [Rhizobium etli 8C-3]
MALNLGVLNRTQEISAAGRLESLKHLQTFILEIGQPTLPMRLCGRKSGPLPNAGFR